MGLLMTRGANTVLTQQGGMAYVSVAVRVTNPSLPEWVYEDVAAGACHAGRPDWREVVQAQIDAACGAIWASANAQSALDAEAAAFNDATDATLADASTEVG